MTEGHATKPGFVQDQEVRSDESSATDFFMNFSLEWKLLLLTLSLALDRVVLSETVL